MTHPKRRQKPTPDTPKTKPKRRKVSATETGRPLVFADLLRIGRVAEPAVAPDSQHVAYVLRRFVEGDDRFHATIHLRDLVTDEDLELTPGPGEHTQPVFS
ncbi:MAG: hypothetical protein KAI47_00625, partial [Deltaproteobacteria bacterium]|nr:hypothetical protein [Deltaproteobacteria bacterium]